MWAGVLVIRQRATSLKEISGCVWRRVWKKTRRPEWTIWEMAMGSQESIGILIETTF